MFDSKTKILIVDDMLTMRKIIARAAREMGFSDFVEAADGNQAWEILTNEKSGIQLVISDWNMPNCTGLELLKRLRADEKYKHLPFLMVTAEAEGHQVAEAVKCGVDNYVIKPFNGATLTEKLTAVYKRRQAA